MLIRAQIGEAAGLTNSMIYKDAPKFHILIVSQNPEDARILAANLRNKLYSVGLAHSTNQGYAKAITSKPDLIILVACDSNGISSGIFPLLQTNPSTKKIPIINSPTPSDKVKIKKTCQAHADSVLEQVSRLIISANRSLSDEADIAARQSDQSKVDFKVKQDANNFIRRHIHISGLTISHIAASLDISISALNKAFETCEGESAFAFMRRERMQCAALLLEQSTLKISEIANEVGYSDSGNFSKEFKIYWYKTPRQFRNESHINI